MTGKINIGLVGAGTIGGGVIKILDRQADFFSTGLGLPIHLRRIADTNTSLFDQLPIGSAICTDNAQDIIDDKEIQIVIELVGGTTSARDIVLRALSAGKHVITANKALLAEHGPEIFGAAEKNGLSVYFEATVGGGMPSIKTVREAMVGNEIVSVKTIINGTCNYILTQMSKNAVPFDQVLRKAQQNGYAEADPDLDIGGGDTGHKVAIMASLLYGGYVPFGKIHIQGITRITPEDISFARDLGYCIKLLGIIRKEGNTVDVRVHPAMLRTDHILASVSDVYNAVLIEGDAVGQILLYGKGAGEMPTASSVVSDIVDVARNVAGHNPTRIAMGYYSTGKTLTVAPISGLTSRYYLRFSVADQPGVLAAIASILGRENISIASVMQKECGASEAVPVVILTHTAREMNLQDAIAEIEKLDMVKDKTQIIRIEE